MKHLTGRPGIPLVTIVAAALLLGPTAPAWAQRAKRAGASATIRTGEVVGRKQVEIKDDSVAKGALIGGAIGLALGSGKSGKDKARRTAAGAGVGAVAGSAKKNPTGIEYTVRTGDGTLVKIVSDQTAILEGDCVAVEEAEGVANIRRIAKTACQPESSAALAEPEIKETMQEEAAECVAAKKLLLAAETAEQIEIAKLKMSLLCGS